MNPVDLGARALFVLAMLSGTSTTVALAVFRRFTNRAEIGGAANRVVAHLMELGLFFDEPVLVLRAQRDLLWENLRLLRGIAVPCALLALPFAFFFVELDTLFGRAPLVVGAPTVITMDWTGSAPVIEAPPGIEVETPPVRAAFSREVSWRIRPVRSVRDRLKIALTGGDLAVPVFAGSGVAYRFASWRVPIRIRYPRATILDLNWVFWYILASLVTALAWNASQA